MADIYVATTGNDSTGNGSSGNPYASPGKAASVAAFGDRILINSGTYLITSASYNVPGGCLDFWQGSEGPRDVQLVGYGLTRPILRASEISSYAMVWTRSTAVYNIDFDANGNSGAAITNFAAATATSCRFRNFLGGIVTNSAMNAYECEFSDNNYGGSDLGVGLAVGCTFLRNTNGSNGYQAQWHGCIFVDNSADCIKSGSSTGCIFYGNAGVIYQLFDNGVTSHVGDLIVNQLGTVTGAVNYGQHVFFKLVLGEGITTGDFPTVNIFGTVSLSAAPFINAAGGDFNLNDTPGGGAVLRAQSFAMPGLDSTVHLPWRQYDNSSPAAGGGVSRSRII